MTRISHKVSRLLCLMLAVVMLIGMLPISALATETTDPNPRAKAVLGDLTGDGVVDNNDVALLLWHTLFEDQYPLEKEQADITEDGIVDNNDVAYLLWHVLFEDKYPLPPVNDPTPPVEPEVAALSSIAVTKNPTKVTYTEGESFDSEGMVVTATYSDKSTKDVTGYTVSGGNKMSAGSKTITISYTENGVTTTTTLKVTVNKKVTRDYDTLYVAIYPYIPDKEIFQEVLADMWEELVPEVELVFDSWDCYSGEPDPGYDLLMYDALFTSYLAANNYISPITEADVEDIDGILDFTMDGATYNNKLYGVPFLACAHFLIYKKDNKAMQNVKTIDDLYKALSNAGTDKGVLIDYTTNLPYLYMDALMDVNAKYNLYDTAPNLNNPNSTVIESLRKLYQVRTNLGTQYDYDAEAFNAGYGSAYVGFSESVAYMDDIAKSNIVITTIPLAGTKNIQMYYTDNVSMTPYVTSEQKKADCLLLMNLVGSEEFQAKVCFDSEEPQYLLPARDSLYDDAAKIDPVYAQLRTIIRDSNNYVARFGTGVYSYIEEAYEVLPGLTKE